MLICHNFILFSTERSGTDRRRLLLERDPGAGIHRLLLASAPLTQGGLGKRLSI